MPFEITREKRGSYKRFSGFVTNAELLQSVFENQSDPDYDRMVYTINDFLAVEGHCVDKETVHMVAAWGLGAAFINANIKLAILTTDPGIRALVGGFTALTRYRLEFFTSVENARAWLALSEDA